MAITITKLGENVVGNQRMVFGKYVTDSGDTGGEITTGLLHIDCMMVTATGSSIVADAPTIDETFPLTGGDATIICTANSSGYWMAFGV